MIRYLNIIKQLFYLFWLSNQLSLDYHIAPKDNSRLSLPLPEILFPVLFIIQLVKKRRDFTGEEDQIDLVTLVLTGIF